MKSAFSIVGIREIIVLGIFYAHERSWNGIKWGKYRLEKLAKVAPAEKKPPVL